VQDCSTYVGNIESGVDAVTGDVSRIFLLQFGQLDEQIPIQAFDFCFVALDACNEPFKAVVGLLLVKLFLDLVY